MNLVGIFAKNREEWLLLEYANFLYNKTMVPFYDTLGPDSITYILK
jgi:long-chain acyl-CoA synthetase